jgi:class 3 adenylate cyclase
MMQKLQRFIRITIITLILLYATPDRCFAQHDTTRCRLLFEKIEAEADDKIWSRHNEELKKITEENIIREDDSSLLSVYRKYLGAAINNEGILNQNKGRSKEAVKLYEQALSLRKEVNDQQGVAETYNNLGLIYHTQGNVPMAIDLYRKSLAIQEKINDIAGMSTSLLNLSVIFFNQGDLDLAREFVEKSLGLMEKSDDEFGRSYALNNLAKIYQAEGKLKLSLETHQRSLDLREKIQDNQGIAFSLMYLGEIEELMDSNATGVRALSLLQRSYNTFHEAGEIEGEAMAGNLLAGYYQRRGALPKAEQLALSSLETGQRLGFPEITLKSARILYSIYKSNGKTADALRMHELYIQMRDSMLNENFRKDNIRTQFQHEYDRKVAADSLKVQEQRLLLEAKVEKEKTRTQAMLAILILTLISSGFIYNRFMITNRQKKKIQQQHMELGEEKKKSDQLLLNILPGETAEELKRTGTTKARRYENVSVLFTDFSNFTGISEKMEPEDLVNEIHECYSAFDAIISNYPIEKIKTIGDGYMCVSGLPAANPHHAIDLLKAAIDMQQYLLTRKEQRRSEGKIYFEARMGIHSGPVVAGTVGTKKFAFDIWGDTVNIAARMEESAAIGCIYLSAGTAELVSNIFQLEDKGFIPVKNRGTMKIFECRERII